MQAQFFRVSLTIPSTAGLGGPMLTFDDLLVMELGQLIPGVDILIGLDFLLLCKLTLDGPARQFTLEF